MKVIIHGRLIGLNEYIRLCRANKYLASKKKSEEENLLIANIKSQLRKYHTDKKIYLIFSFYEKDKRRDPDNISAIGHKFFLDALVKAKVINNDGWKNIGGFSDCFFVDKENPRIEVEITDKEKIEQLRIELSSIDYPLESMSRVLKRLEKEENDVNEISKMG